MTAPRAPATLALLAAGLWLSACARSGTAQEFVDATRSAHQRADQALAAGEWDTARHALRRLAERAAPADLAARDERVVRQDALFRLAELELTAGRPAAALAWVDQGLRLGAGDDVFATNLYVARGHALEQLGRSTEAVRAYGQAQEISTTLLERALGGQEE